MASKQPSAISPYLFVGIKDCVIALDKQTGAIVWTTKLRSTSLVTVVHENERVFATAHGEVWCLSAANGAIVWHNPLKGYGAGWTSISGAGAATNVGAVAGATAAAAAAAAGAAAAS